MVYIEDSDEVTNFIRVPNMVKGKTTRQILPVCVSPVLSRPFPCIGRTKHTPDRSFYLQSLSFAAAYS